MQWYSLFTQTQTTFVGLDGRSTDKERGHLKGHFREAGSPISESIELGWDHDVNTVAEKLESIVCARATMRSSCTANRPSIPIDGRFCLRWTSIHPRKGSEFRWDQRDSLTEGDVVEKTQLAKNHGLSVPWVGQ